jgi:glutathione S-transferase
MSGITLYNYELDEQSYRARLALSILGLEWTTIAIDMFPGEEQKKPPMLALNPLGTLPVLRDGDLVLSGTAAILSAMVRHLPISPCSRPSRSAATMVSITTNTRRFAAGSDVSAL